MRKSMGVRLFATVACMASLTAGFIACSGSDDQDVSTTPDSGGGFDASLPDTSQPDTSKPDTGNPDTGTKDSGPQFDAGPPVTLDGGDLYDGGVPCVQGGLLEEEPNDDTTTANHMSPTDAGCTQPGCSRCGVVFVTDLDAGADAGESDFLTFSVRPGVKDFYLQFAGNVTLTVTVEGKPPVVITQTQSPTLPLVRDKPYYVEVKSANGKQQTWRVTLFEIL